MMKIKIFNKNFAQVNSYLLIKQKEAILIDPGFNGDEINKYCKENEINILHVILTHGHFDHIKDLSVISKEHDYKLYISSLEKEFLDNDEINYARGFGAKFNKPNNKIIELNDLDEIVLLDEKFKIISTPGHTKGSISIKYNRNLFTGDTLFYNSVGRTDLYSGNQTVLFKSIEKISKTIGNDYRIYPGHGPNGLLKQIKNINPYIK
ncbi:MBL fold metallo-hydrolase [Candidatus Izemoplasma sp. B36]|uniref:MBL fold metallo-hydrolase n=1 Tax=Candidatus Izemoplasma sp. B36 TaxID=3242468 RepID=UPI003558BDA0